MEKLAEAILRGEYNEPPADIFGPDDSIPAAEILGGSLDAGFGIDHGEEEDTTDADEAEAAERGEL